MCVMGMQIFCPHLGWPPRVERQVTGRLVSKQAELEREFAEVKENQRQLP